MWLYALFRTLIADIYQLGISNDDHVFVYDSNANLGMFFAPQVWFMFRVSDIILRKILSLSHPHIHTHAHTPHTHTPFPQLCGHDCVSLLV